MGWSLPSLSRVLEMLNYLSSLPRRHHETFIFISDLDIKQNVKYTAFELAEKLLGFFLFWDPFTGKEMK